MVTFNPIIRDEQSRDRAAVRRVNELAFGRPDEADLVEALHRNDCAVVALLAEAAGEVIGHIVFSPVDVGIGLSERLAGLAPMAVMPAFQRRGVGGLLVEAGLKRCAELGFDGVVVLGSPTYYSRFGFGPAHHFGLQCVYEVPPEAFMALPLPGRSLASMSGTVRYHLAFDNLGDGGPPEEAPGTSPGRI